MTILAYEVVRFHCWIMLHSIVYSFSANISKINGLKQWLITTVMVPEVTGELGGFSCSRCFQLGRIQQVDRQVQWI